MKCPLFSHKTYIEDEWPTQVHEDCLKEECAWWSKGAEICAISRISLSLFLLTAILEVIKDKLPPGGQG